MFIKKEVVSSAINNVSYEKETRILRVEFSSGLEYDYPEVPENEFENLVAAPSVGQYFNKYIKRYSLNNQRVIPAMG